MKKIQLVLLSVTVVLALVVTFAILTPPSKENTEMAQYLPSVINDLQHIASKPHSVADKRNLNEVKEYLVSRLSQMGLEQRINTHEVNNWFGQYDVHNITAQIDGAESAPYILVMAHYDSVMENLNMDPTKSTGMADDGYGVATLLLIADYFSNRKEPLNNGIKFLLTDSEETGPLAGSNAELTHNEPYYQDVALVINLEGRGNDGPVFMFQASASNPDLLNLLQEAEFPVANSFMTELFGFMPNSTDLSPFLERDFSGLNFSTLGHLRYYHSDDDQMANLNEDTLNHYGLQIMPIVQSFVSDEAIASKNYFDKESRYTYFNLFPNHIIAYSYRTQIIILLVTSLSVLAAAMLLIKTDRIQSKGILRHFIVLAIGLIAAIVIGTLILFILSMVSGIPFNPIFMFDLKYDFLIAPFLLTLWIILIGSIYWRGNSNKGFTYESLIAGVAMNLLISMIMVIFIPGGAYIFTVPNLFAALYVLSCALNQPLIGNLLSILHLFVTAILYGTTLYILYYALTIGILGILMFLVTSILFTLVPILLLSCRQSSDLS